MLRILVVDDDSEKLRAVARAIGEIPGISLDDIFDARDATSAKRLLKQQRFDLLILDIALPLRNDQDPIPTGGLDLLDEIISRPMYLRPDHVVGLTAYPEVLESAKSRFENDLWSVVHFDRTSDVWVGLLKRKIEHIIAVQSATKAQVDYEADLCIVTALREPELAAVLDLPWNWTDLHVPGDMATYHQGSFSNSDETRSVFATAAPLMGMAAAAAVAMKMVARFRPRYLAMTGMLAGSKDETSLGDVVIGNPTWDWGSGKHLLRQGSKEFAPAPYQLCPAPEIMAAVNKLQSDPVLLSRIQSEWPGPRPNTVLQVFSGPVASGASVLADQQIFEEIKNQHRKLLGVDMEAYGIMSTASISPFPQPKAVVIKGVSDYADENKSDDYQSYASYCSARVMAEIFESIWAT